VAYIFAEKKIMNFLKFKNEAATDTAEIIIEGAIGCYNWEKPDEAQTQRKQELRKELQRIKDIKAKNILVKIDSLGGYVDHALSIYDMLCEHPAKVTTQINGMCASAATIVFMAGEERKISKNALFLIHKCSTFFIGNANELKALLGDQNTIDERLISIYTDKCTAKREEIETLFNENNGNGIWINAEKATEMGFASQIYNESKIKNFFNSITNIFNNQIPKIMTKFIALYPILAVALAINETREFEDGKDIPMSKTEMGLLEKLVTDLKADLVAAQKAKADAEAAKATAEAAKVAAEEAKTAAEAKRDELQAKIDKTPANTQIPTGADNTPNTSTSSFEDYVKNDPYYQSITKEL
jgi:ATP-dependent protease ClpP protease subunit